MAARMAPRGGKRDGAGRRPIDEGGTVQRNIAMSREMAKQIAVYAQVSGESETEMTRKLIQAGLDAWPMRA